MRTSRVFTLDEVLTCYHDDADHCDCRKPQPGLIMIADRCRDIDAGANAGCKTILLDRGYAEWVPASAPDARVGSLPDAVDWILKTTTEIA